MGACRRVFPTGRGGKSPPAMADRFEYKIITDDPKTPDIEAELEAAGRMGWELVTVTPLSEQVFRTFYFKRQLKN